MHSYTLSIHNPSAPEQAVNLDLLLLKKTSIVLRALNHKLRQQILQLIDQKAKVTVTEIYIHLRVEQSVASQHLAILRKAGFVNTTREGKFIYYSINLDRMQALTQFMDQLLK
jgi:DNA-binding transcriptional ArsR family regulator